MSAPCTRLKTFKITPNSKFTVYGNRIFNVSVVYQPMSRDYRSSKREKLPIRRKILCLISVNVGTLVRPKENRKPFCLRVRLIYDFSPGLFAFAFRISISKLRILARHFPLRPLCRSSRPLLFPSQPTS